jgi:hypothetical protein
MQGTDSNLRRVSSESSGSSNRRYDNWTRRISRSITKYFLYFLLLYLIVYSVILPFWQSLTRCDQVPFILMYAVILCTTYILMTPIFLLCYRLQDNRLQNITGVSCISTCHLIFCIFIVILPTITYNNDVIVQQGDKVYQCVDVHKLPPQAYPVVSDFNSSVIEDYRGHGYSCDLSSYGPIVPYEQTLEALPNYLKYNNGSRFFDALVCKQNDPEGVGLCHRYVSVSSDRMFLWSLICNCMSDQSRLVNGGYAGVAAIRCLWNRCIWIIVS